MDTPIPIALHITSEPVPLFLQRFGTWPSSGNNNEYRGSHTRAVYTQSVAPKKMRIMSPSMQKGGGEREREKAQLAHHGGEAAEGSAHCAL